MQLITLRYIAPIICRKSIIKSQIGNYNWTQKRTSCKGKLRQDIAFVVKLQKTYNFPFGFGELKINGQVTSASRISNSNHQLRP